MTPNKTKTHYTNIELEEKMKTDKEKQNQNRRWTASECLEALYPKANRIQLIRLAVLSGAVRKMK